MWIAVLAVILVVAALAVVMIVKRATPPITVQTTKVSRHSLTNLVVANGKIQPVVQVTISPEVSGEIIELPVKEGQFVHKGDLLLKINPDVYIAALNQAKAGYESSLAAKAPAVANLEKAEADYKRNKELFDRKLLSESDFIGFKVARDVAKAQLESADDQVDVAKAAVDNAQDLLNKTTIVSPLDGTITTLNSQLGERVLGTVQNDGTDIMIISDLSQMEARVDIGEMDVVLHRARPESAAGSGRVQGPEIRRRGDGCRQLRRSGSKTASSTSSGSSQSQEATQFEVRIRVNDKEGLPPRHVRDGGNRNPLPHQCPDRSAGQRHHPPDEVQTATNAGTNTASRCQFEPPMSPPARMPRNGRGNNLHRPPRRRTPPNRWTWFSWWKATT